MFILSLLFACGDQKSQEEVSKTKTDTPKKEASVSKPTSSTFDPVALQKMASAIYQPLPETMPGTESDTPEKISLGKALYFEKALSINDTQSCNSCHDITNGNMGVDNEPTSPGAKGERGGRNSPTSVNAGFHVAQFWDGRAADLKAQAKGPILNPIEMGLPSEEAAIEKLSIINDYPTKFAKAFPESKEALNYDNLAEAIASFERTLISRDRFDTYLKGDITALTEQEQRGLKAFVDTGCISCHSGSTIGGNNYQKLGVYAPYTPNGKENTDHGRLEVTKSDADKDMFKVPSLRNIEKTAPYFHDGQVQTLEEAVQIMAKIQLNKELSKEQVTDITVFLTSLTGTLPNQ
jgi:cytochrome c peroxidase